MCDRYFITLPAKPTQAQTRALILNKALKNVQAGDVLIHPKVFFRPLSNNNGSTGKQQRLLCHNENLRQNILLLSKLTKNFGLFLTQCHWLELLTLAEGQIIMSEKYDMVQCIKMYRMILKKEACNFSKLINAFHMTGNHHIANLIERRIHQIEASESLEKKHPTAHQSSTTKKTRTTGTDSSSPPEVKSNEINDVSKQNRHPKGTKMKSNGNKHHSVNGKPQETINKNAASGSSRTSKHTVILISRMVNHLKRFNTRQFTKLVSSQT